MVGVVAAAVAASVVSEASAAAVVQRAMGLAMRAWETDPEEGQEDATAAAAAIHMPQSPQIPQLLRLRLSPAPPSAAATPAAGLARADPTGTRPPDPNLRLVGLTIHPLPDPAPDPAPEPEFRVHISRGSAGLQVRILPQDSAPSAAPSDPDSLPPPSGGPDAMLGGLSPPFRAAITMADDGLSARVQLSGPWSDPDPAPDPTPDPDAAPGSSAAASIPQSAAGSAAAVEIPPLEIPPLDAHRNSGRTPFLKRGTDVDSASHQVPAVPAVSAVPAGVGPVHRVDAGDALLTAGVGVMPAAPAGGLGVPPIEVRL